MSGDAMLLAVGFVVSEWRRRLVADALVSALRGPPAVRIAGAVVVGRMRFEGEP